MKYVIIGNSVAGINAATAIRQNDTQGEILIISDEQTRPYSRPLLPNWVIGEVSFSQERMFYRRNDFFEKNNIKTLLGKKVESIDTKAKIVSISNSESLPYDKLIITSGASAILPKNIVGIELEGIHTLTNIKGARKLKENLDNIGSIVIVGAGLIGTKMAYDLSKIGKKVVLVELAKRVLFPALDDYAAGLIQEELKENGVEIILNDSVVQLNGDEKVSEVVLASNKKIPCDACLLSVGVFPNIPFVDENIKVDRGIVVDDYLKACDDCYAAGDVASVYDIVANIRRPIPILPLAAKEGFISGLNASGSEVKFNGGFAMNSIEIGNIGFISMGLIESDNDEVLEYKKDNEYRKFIIRDNRLIGVILVNNVEKVGMFNWMIEKGFDVSWIKDTFLNSDFGWKYFDKAFRVLRLDRKLKG
ncbi:Nitrite reductase probable [NAD(P)H] subunit [Desulfurella amilsii]|uniref:Nitrite reductase probable [NAD(P)H] subunit n=1 Tax=Desulfurella amilsii TaxID=1562698 RepID=A0A1X4XXI6_9BACT|nr:FAD-dependent oxidoreductase [Desulfurella amilsii]OSS42235.1 Nitrite reductase probable [NAD(P)H] subunit [Desulfurella amilsii]